MAFSKKQNLENKNIGEVASYPSGDEARKPAEAPKAPLVDNKATRLAALIKSGGQTKEMLMAAIEVNAAGLASQLSYLNTRGLNIAEIDPARAEFPMKDDKGIYYMADFASYMAKRGDGSTSGIAKTRTVAELKEFAQKREDKASAAAAKAKDKYEANKADDILRLQHEIAELELQLAGAKLAAVERGDYSYESCKVSDAA